MGVEALLLVQGLQRHTEYADRVWISPHGDAVDYEVFAGLEPGVQREVAGMLRAPQAAGWDAVRRAVVVCHSEPGAWSAPRPLYETPPCPPLPLGEAAYVVARAMFETSGLSAEHVQRCNQMDAVWVPTEFHRQTFAAAGVDASKLRVVPEPVDSTEFDPSRHEALPLPLGTRVFGPRWRRARPGGTAGGQQRQGEERRGQGRQQGKPFVFLSTFKWEARKGWDVLLRAYLQSFTADDDVLLLLHTKPFHSDSNFAEQMQDWAERELPAATAAPERLPPVYVLGTHLPQREYPRLFASADAFVLPTRGEGWGLPVVEAMAMALPVIVTNYSGPTAYLDSTVGYPLRWQPAEAPPGSGAFSGHLWAEPSVDHLSELMRHVVAHPGEAAARGAAARRRMLHRYSLAAVAQAVAAELRSIELQLAGAGARRSKQRQLEGGGTEEGKRDEL